jgi:hypothetical protein
MTHLMPNDIVSLSACMFFHSKEKDIAKSVRQLTMSVSLSVLSSLKGEMTTGALRTALLETVSLYQRTASDMILDRLLLAFSFRKAILNTKRARYRSITTAAAAAVM